MQPPGDLRPEQTAHLVAEQVAKLVRRNLDLRVERQVVLDIGGELGEELLASCRRDPVCDRRRNHEAGHAGDPLDLLDPRAVRQGQLEDDRFLALDHQPRGVGHVDPRVEGGEHDFQKQKRNRATPTPNTVSSVRSGLRSRFNSSRRIG